MKHPSKIQLKKHLGDAGQRAAEAARAVGDAAKASARIYLAATFGNPAEKALSLEAHDPLRDAELARGEVATTPSSSAPRGGSVPDADLAKLFRATGTAVWKLEQRMLDPDTKEPKDDFRRIWRHVEAIKDALTDVGVEIIDWTGKRYDEGMSLKVVAEEERPGEREATIAETLLPTIRFRRQIQLQQGEVVVGRPASNASTTEQAKNTEPQQ